MPLPPGGHAMEDGQGSDAEGGGLGRPQGPDKSPAHQAAQVRLQEERLVFMHTASSELRSTDCRPGP